MQFLSKFSKPAFTLVGALLAMSASATTATAHELNQPHVFYGLEHAPAPRKVSFHKHWMLACATDPAFGFDRCKAQSFDYGPKIAGKTRIDHSITLSSRQVRNKDDSYNLNFKAHQAEIDFTKPLSLSIDFGTWKELEPIRGFRANLLNQEQAVINLDAPTNAGLLEQLAAGNNLRVKYNTLAGEKVTTQLSLLGYKKAMANLNSFESAPPLSDPLKAELMARSELQGKWTAKDTTIIFDSTQVDRREGRTTYYYSDNPGGGGATYSTVLYGHSSFASLHHMLRTAGFAGPQATNVLKRFIKPGHQYPAVMHHFTSAVTLTAKLNNELSLHMNIQPRKQLRIMTLTKAPDESAEAPSS